MMTMETWKKNLAVLWIAQFLVMGAMNQIMPFLPLMLTKELGLSADTNVHLWTGLIFGINFLPALIFSPIWGNLADKYGRKMMILRSGFGMALTNGLMGFVQTPTEMLMLRFLNGMISGFIPASIALVSTNTPREKTGFSLGVLQSGGVAGTILGPALGGLLADAIGYRAIFWVTGGALFLSTLLVLFFVKEENKPVPKEMKGEGWRKDLAHIVSTRPLPALFATGMLVQFSLIALMPILAHYTESLIHSTTRVAFFAGLVMAATGVANMIASPFLGRLGDRIGSQKVLYISLIFAGIIMFFHAWTKELWQLILVRFLFGLSVGGLMPAVNALIRASSPEGMVSRTYGYANSATFLGNMIGPIVGGLISGWWGMSSVFIFSALVLFLNALLVHSKVMPELEKKAPGNQTVEANMRV
ncbi:MAG: Multidrug-efflux transporter, major facilitator superfamily (MFS) [Candidatus Carbobacillus altaicus]|uniref:Multidrug-efflux transporter, major facilitator superfamily (MFS) n=1 Tax=Candidatus Carbonibacillus altaicus TaxID=2163959 RepID=A0A2R6Y268_9BACL|nr:MAG: Multidrug-efflux transporter, major facilitator superfamily (MFS) [Candidatus Carbobacillus altaicus]